MFPLYGLAVAGLLPTSFCSLPRSRTTLAFLKKPLTGSRAFSTQERLWSSQLKQLASVLLGIHAYPGSIMDSLTPACVYPGSIMDTLTSAYLQTLPAGADNCCSEEVRFSQSDQDVALSSNKTRLHQAGQLLLHPLHQGPLHLRLAAHQDRATWHQ